MKAVFIVGSPNKEGSVSTLMDSIIHTLDEDKIEVRKHYLGDMNIGFCQGCKACQQTGKCSLKDDMSLIVSDIAQSDIVVVGSPSYWGDVTGQLKVFIDRNTPYGDTNPKSVFPVSQKIGVSIAVRTGKAEKENVQILNTIEHYFGHMQIKPFAQISACGIDAVDDLRKREDVISQANLIGKNITEWATIQRNRK